MSKNKEDLDKAMLELLKYYKIDDDDLYKGLVHIRIIVDNQRGTVKTFQQEWKKQCTV